MPTVQGLLDAKSSDVVSLDVAASVLDAAHIMSKRSIGSVVVTKAGDVVGIFTERDLLKRVVAQHLEPPDTTLADVMSTPVVTCRPETKMEESSAVMVEKGIRRLPVMEGSRLVGIVTTHDILAHQVRNHKGTIRDLIEYIFDVP